LGQLLINGLGTGLIVALPSIALSLSFGILKFPNFAIGAMLTTAAYIAWSLNIHAGLPLLAAGALCIILFPMVALLCDAAVFRPLRSRGPVTLLVASMGLSFVLDNVCRLIFGNDARNFDIALSRPYRVWGLRINYELLVSAGVSIGAMILVFLILKHTSIGRAMRAVADNPNLAAARGIDAKRVIAATWILAGVLIAASGVLIGMDRAIDPQLGWNYIIVCFAAAILGGLGNPAGAVFGALLLGVVGELATLVVATNYRSGVGFLVIALVLLFRPNGLFGTREIVK
jgi:branched-subunit amino acid ABC-type transport system permease component